MTDKTLLTRETLLNGDVERLLHRDGRDPAMMSDDQRKALVDTTLDTMPAEAELWVFGYGSLIWNPAIEFDAQRRCSISGLERKFCFWTTLSRGTEQHPGLMMGLVDGNNCDGLAYRINRQKAASELDILFRREMSTYVYKPTWIDARCADSEATFSVLTFVVDTSHERYVDDLSHQQTVSTLATARGPLGRNCDYLFTLTDALEKLGFEDKAMTELHQQVVDYQQQNFSGDLP
jgi:cation transport protein ChaC